MKSGSEGSPKDRRDAAQKEKRLAKRQKRGVRRSKNAEKR
jgi:hypothetical protein